MTDMLSFEILELCFLHFHSLFDKRDIYSCLTVSKRFHTVMSSGPALYEDIYIISIAQLGQLADHFSRNPGKGNWVNFLEFQYHNSSQHTDSQLEYSLAAVLTLLEAIPNVRHLHEVPLRPQLYDQGIVIIQKMRRLKSLGVTAFRGGACSDFLEDYCQLWAAEDISMLVETKSIDFLVFGQCETWDFLA